MTTSSSYLKIATHDSATGERGYGLLSFLLTPFARTQSKNIRAQYHAGCTSFDIRLKKTRRGWVCAHGLWQSRRSAASILSELNDFARQELLSSSSGRPIYVSLTLEGNESQKEAFTRFSAAARRQYRFLSFGASCIKYSGHHRVRVSYETVQPQDPTYRGYGAQGFTPLDATNLCFLLPIPWLWDRLRSRPHRFYTSSYTYVDFL